MLRRPETLTEAVINHVRDAIISGAYAPGSPLPEGALASELGTSRGTIREALRALADDGLVDLFPHRRALVSSISLAKAQEIYEVRGILEPYAVRLGVERGRLTDRAYAEEVRGALAELGRVVLAGDQTHIVEVERHLHRLLWISSDQTVLIDLLSGLQIQTRRILMHTRAFDRGVVEIKVHEQLVEAVLSGDPSEAERATREHLLRSREHMLERMAKVEPTATASDRNRERTDSRTHAVGRGPA